VNGRTDLSSELLEVVNVAGPAGDRILLRNGERIVFGRSPDVELPLDDDPWLSRRAGEIAVVGAGVRISNLSTRHSLHVNVGDELMRLPVVTHSTGDFGFFLSSGTAVVGTGSMIDQRRGIRLELPESWALPRADEPGWSTAPQLITELPVRLDISTKEFMVAFLLCRPWLLDSTRMAPLPQAPELARRALELTGAHHLLRDFEASGIRSRLAQQVHDHLKELRTKIYRAGLVRPDEKLSLSAIASILLHYDVIGPRHLALERDSAWLSRQENKWWGIH
jgi:hypothetical protein